MGNKILGKAFETAEIPGLNEVYDAPEIQQAIFDRRCSAGNREVGFERLQGVGLNITEANHVLHYTRLWNPAKEDQATDRVYRIGQKRDVHVHYLLAVAPDDQFETFDVKLDYLLQEKRSLSRDFLLSTEKIDVRPQALMDAVFSGMESDFNPAV